MMPVPGHWQKKVERRPGRPNRPGPTVRTGYLVGLAQAYQEPVSFEDVRSIKILFEKTNLTAPESTLKVVMPNETLRSTSRSNIAAS